MTCGEEGKPPMMLDTTRSQAAKSTSHPGIFAGTCLLALVLLVSAYSNSFHNAFHFDDNHVIDVVWTLRFHLTFNSGASFSLPYPHSDTPPTTAAVAVMATTASDPRRHHA